MKLLKALFAFLFGKKKKETEEPSKVLYDFEEVSETVPYFDYPYETSPDVATLAEEDLSLKEAMASAKENAFVIDKISKATVAEFLSRRYGDAITVNRRENYIKSGLLPLADTHYKTLPTGKKCFIYVYELDGGNVFFLVRVRKETADLIKRKHHTFRHSAFPKTKAGDWYAMFVDDTFSSPAEVLETLALIFEDFGEDVPVTVLPKVDVVTAHDFFSDDAVEQLVEEASKKDVRFGEEGKEVIINVDTLSEEFEDGDEITIHSLKEKLLISKKARRIKILARGTLNKKFTLVADSFSKDAAKMILATGGTMIKLQKKGNHHEE